MRISYTNYLNYHWYDIIAWEEFLNDTSTTHTLRRKSARLMNQRCFQAIPIRYIYIYYINLVNLVYIYVFLCIIFMIIRMYLVLMQENLSLDYPKLVNRLELLQRNMRYILISSIHEKLENLDFFFSLFVLKRSSMLMIMISSLSK